MIVVVPFFHHCLSRGRRDTRGRLSARDHLGLSEGGTCTAFPVSISLLAPGYHGSYLQAEACDPGGTLS